MELKGIETLEMIVNDFVKQFDCVASLSSDFWVDINKNHIYFSLFCTEESNREFMSTVNKCNPKVSMDIFLWGLLHEIFHVETYDDLTEEELDYCYKVKHLIEENKIDKMEYYNLPIERLATEGAVKYANTHIEELADLWKKLQQAILKFYELNDIH